MPSRKLRGILSMPEGDHTERELRRGKLLSYADSIGAPTKGVWSKQGLVDEPELVRRIVEAERSLRDGRLWLVALISALASLVSAVAAWVAVLG